MGGGGGGGGIILGNMNSFVVLMVFSSQSLKCDFYSVMSFADRSMLIPEGRGETAVESYRETKNQRFCTENLFSLTSSSEDYDFMS